MAALTAFDILVLLLIGLGAVMGVLRGFVTEVLSLIAWVAAIFALRLFYDPAAVLAADLVGSEAGGAILAFSGLFLVTFVTFRLIARTLGHRTRTSVIGPVDRLLGLGFGAFKGLIGASLLFLLVMLASDLLGGPEEEPPAWLRASRTYPLLELTSKAMVDFVEERRQAQETPTAAEEGGYSSEDRDALDDLLDTTGGTRI